MRQIDFNTIVHSAWTEFEPERPVASIVDVSVNVSTNHVYRIDLEDGAHLFAKLSYFGSYEHFREDHSIIHALGDALGPPYESVLASSFLRDGKVWTYRHEGHGASLGEDVWVVFYHPVEVRRRLPRRLGADDIALLGTELARFHRACTDALPDESSISKTTRYDLEELLAAVDSEDSKFEYWPFDDVVRTHCEAYLRADDEFGSGLPKTPVFVDWNIGNFSLDDEGRIFSRWDYDWFRVSSRVFDFYFFSRVVSEAGGPIGVQLRHRHLGRRALPRIPPGLSRREPTPRGRGAFSFPRPIDSSSSTTS